MKTEDRAGISPGLTKAGGWIQGRGTEAEGRSSTRLVASAKASSGGIFSGKDDLFNPQEKEICTH